MVVCNQNRIVNGMLSVLEIGLEFGLEAAQALVAADWDLKKIVLGPGKVAFERTYVTPCRSNETPSGFDLLKKRNSLEGADGLSETGEEKAGPAVEGNSDQ